MFHLCCRRVLCLVLVTCSGHLVYGQGPASSDFALSYPVAPPDDSFYKTLPPEYQKRLNEALALLKEVWSSDAFKQKVLAFQFHHYGDNDDASSALVYQIVTKAHPKPLTWYLCKVPADALASTSPMESTSCVYQAYMDASTTTSHALANTLAHEFTHTVAGGLYEHSYRPRPSRPYTVPYAIGDLTETVVDDMHPLLQKTAKPRPVFEDTLLPPHKR